MDKLTTIEKLDIIIDYLYDNDRNEIDSNVIANALTQINQYQITRLLATLKDDGYVVYSLVWGLSVNGYILKESGGIKGLIASKKNDAQYYEDEKTRRRKVDSDLVENTSRLNRLTFWLLVVTAFVGLIALTNAFIPYIFCPLQCSK